MSIREVEIEVLQTNMISDGIRVNSWSSVRTSSSIEEILLEDTRRQLEFELAKEQLNRVRSGRFVSSQSTKTVTCQQTTSKISWNVEKAIEELAQREDMGSRLESLAKRHPGASKLLQNVNITIQDLSKHQRFFKEIITLLFEKTSYNRLLVDYEQLCVERVLEQVRGHHSIQLQNLQQGNNFSKLMKQLIEPSAFLTNLCLLMRSPSFPIDLFDRKEVEYLLCLLPPIQQKKKKKNKKKKGKKAPQTQAQTQERPQGSDESEDEDEIEDRQAVRGHESPLTAEDLQTQKLIWYLAEIEPNPHRIQCDFTEDYIKKLSSSLREV